MQPKPPTEPTLDGLERKWVERWARSGVYRFDRLSPGSYNVKFELQGFKTVIQSDIRISASFVATVNGKLDVGSVTESITVTAEAPVLLQKTMDRRGRCSN